MSDPPDAPPGERIPEPWAVYDRIAAHFAETREHPWPEVEEFVAAHATAGQRALDLGCGNGRHAELLAAHGTAVIGLDASRELLREARARAAERPFDLTLIQGDAAGLPLAADSLDLGLYVATLHHLRPRTRRQESLDEFARVLRPGAPALVSAWSTAHDRFDGAGDADAEGGFDTTVDWTLPGGERVPRFYHIYDPAEFRADLATSDLSVVEQVVSSGNCYAVVRG